MSFMKPQKLFPFFNLFLTCHSLSGVEPENSDMLDLYFHARDHHLCCGSYSSELAKSVPGYQHVERMMKVFEQPLTQDSGVELKHLVQSIRKRRNNATNNLP